MSRPGPRRARRAPGPTRHHGRGPVPYTTVDDARMVAAVDLLGRSGAAEFQVRYDDEEKPVVWLAVARWDIPRGGVGRWECAAALDPLRAVFRLCDEVIDGGTCQHCARPTGFSPDLDPLPLDELICWYQYDPELKTFRRGCAGDAP